MHLVLVSVISLYLITANCNKSNHSSDVAGIKSTTILGSTENEATSSKPATSSDVISSTLGPDDYEAASIMPTISSDIISSTVQGSNNYESADNKPAKTSKAADQTKPMVICMDKMEGIDQDEAFTKQYMKELKKSLHGAVKHAILTKTSFNATQAEGAVVLTPKNVTKIELEFIKIQTEGERHNLITYFMIKIPEITFVYDFLITINTIGSVSGLLYVDLYNQVVSTKFTPLTNQNGEKCYHQITPQFKFIIESHRVYYKLDNATTVKEEWGTFGKVVINTFISIGLYPVLEILIIECLKNVSMNNLSNISGNSKPSSILGFEEISEGQNSPVDSEGELYMCKMPDITAGEFFKLYMKKLRESLRNSTNNLSVIDVPFNNSQGAGEMNLRPVEVSGIQLQLAEYQSENSYRNVVINYYCTIPEITIQYKFRLSVKTFGDLSGNLFIEMHNDAAAAKIVTVPQENGSICYEQLKNNFTFRVERYDVDYAIDRSSTMKRERREWGQRILNTFIRDELCKTIEDVIKEQVNKVQINKSSGEKQ